MDFLSGLIIGYLCSFFGAFFGANAVVKKKQKRRKKTWQSGEKLVHATKETSDVRQPSPDGPTYLTNIPVVAPDFNGKEK